MNAFDLELRHEIECLEHKGIRSTCDPRKCDFWFYYIIVMHNDHVNDKKVIGMITLKEDGTLKFVGKKSFSLDSSEDIRKQIVEKL